MTPARYKSNLINTIKNEVKKIQEKFKFDEKKAKDLYEWHKDSSPLTKNDDGTPKVFYHGNKNGNEIEIFKDEFDNSGWGVWLTPRQDLAQTYGYLQEVFIKGQNFLDLEKFYKQHNLKEIADFLK